MAKTLPRNTLEAVVDDVIKKLQQAERICTASYKCGLATNEDVKLRGIRKLLRICTVKVFSAALGDETKSPTY